MAEKPKAVIKEEYIGVCATAMVCVSNGTADCLLCLNCIFPTFGTFIGSLLDENGCNCQTFLLCILQSLLCSVFGIGWIWGIIWSCDVRSWNKDRNEFIIGGGQTNTAPLMDPP